MVRETPKLKCWDVTEQGKEWDCGCEERTHDRNQMLVSGNSVFVTLFYINKP